MELVSLAELLGIFLLGEVLSWELCKTIANCQQNGVRVDLTYLHRHRGLENQDRWIICAAGAIRTDMGNYLFG